MFTTILILCGLLALWATFLYVKNLKSKALEREAVIDHLEMNEDILRCNIPEYYYIAPFEEFYDVMAYYAPGVDARIKEFRFNPLDPEDREFAYNLAVELLDKLNEK